MKLLLSELSNHYKSINMIMDENNNNMMYQEEDSDSEYDLNKLFNTKNNKGNTNNLFTNFEIFQNFIQTEENSEQYKFASAMFNFNSQINNNNKDGINRQTTQSANDMEVDDVNSLRTSNTESFYNNNNNKSNIRNINNNKPNLVKKQISTSSQGGASSFIRPPSKNEKTKIPILKEFKPKFTKRENIDKKNHQKIQEIFKNITAKQQEHFQPIR